MSRSSNLAKAAPVSQNLAMTELVGALVDSYRREQQITHVSTAVLPSRDSVIAILTHARQHEEPRASVPRQEADRIQASAGLGL